MTFECNCFIVSRPTVCLLEFSRKCGAYSSSLEMKRKIMRPTRCPLRTEQEANIERKKKTKKKVKRTEKWLAIIARAAELMSWGCKPSVNVLTNWYQQLYTNAKKGKEIKRDSTNQVRPSSCTKN